MDAQSEIPYPKYLLAPTPPNEHAQLQRRIIHESRDITPDRSLTTGADWIRPGM